MLLFASAMIDQTILKTLVFGSQHSIEKHYTYCKKTTVLM